ncbi:hypothetical protein INS49_009422 [Diaporthe citri]|uniref:uncharacterized protein n=1 Tax=Diaporthe citri TaxID=83186 RepID=UPI001C81170A|nr:uncharacterized protein INS49_009422 [Diaporthe citri]KAG6361198.1 hypothetical protein INS49_009422 [Diaporthe citri]
MASEPDPEDIRLLVDAIKNRKRFPRSLCGALRAAKEASHETIGRIFFDCGGPSTWASYFLVSESTKKSGHVSGRGRKQRLIAKMENQSVEDRRALARHLTIALEPSRAQIERDLETAIHPARRSGQRQFSIESFPTARYHADSPDTPTLGSPARASDVQPIAASPRFRGDLSPAPQAMDLRNMAQYFSEPGQALVQAVIPECTRLFPSYLAGSIRRYPLPDNADVITAAVSIMLPRPGWPGCPMRIEVVGSKVDHIAQELFDVHLEAEGGCRYIYLPGGSTVAPDPHLVLRHCRLDRLHRFFGARVADAIRTTPTFQMDIKEGRDHTVCVSMVIPSAVDDTGEIYALLCQSDTALLRESLYF